jgi:predicted nucleotidyltransferase
MMIRASRDVRQALVRTAEAIEALGARGMRAWAVGSLARGEFRPSSDVDILVECPPGSEYEAFRLIEDRLGDQPFDVIPAGRLHPRALTHLMEEAVDASVLRARQAAAG